MKKLYRANFLARRVTLIYVLVSGLWILLSDYFLDAFLPESETLKINILKGLLFVAVTATLLYVLIRTGERSRLKLYNILIDIIEGTSDAIFVKDENDRYLVVNSSAAYALGKTKSEIIGKTDYAFFSEQDLNQIQATNRRILNSGKSEQLEETVTLNDQEITYLTNKYPRFDYYGNIIGLIGIARDITERKKLQREREQLQNRLWLQIERTPLACIFKDAQGKITDWNSAAERLFGYTKAEVLGKETLELIVPTSRRELVQEVMNRLRAGDMDAHGITENVTKSGELLTCRWFNTPLMDENGDVIGTFSVIENITDKVNLENQLRDYAYYDDITKLPNRKFLKEELVKKLETVETLPKLALLHLDLVRFKTLKYSLGYQLIEDLLSEIAETLISRLPDKSFCAKVGSDEFIILLEDIETEAEAIAWVETIQELFLSPFDINEHRIFTNVKVGVVLTKQWCGSAEEILQAGDTAMNYAKFSSTQDYAVFDPKMQESAIARILLDSQMRQGLDNQEFEVYYQPILALETQKIVGFEALLRWQKNGGYISPGQFIPIAEETGFIITLDNWVLHQACSQLQQWRLNHQKYHNLYISVNVSAVELIQPNFLDRVNQVLQETGLPPHHLKLEITETSVMENAEKVSAILEQLNQQQIRLCLDDFGTGYSSLSYLRQFPFEVMKIDRSFLTNLSYDPNKHRKLIETMALLARNLEMDIVVEGIETQQQLTILKQLGCQKGQGYLFSRPLPRSQIETLFNEEQEIINI